MYGRMISKSKCKRTLKSYNLRRKTNIKKKKMWISLHLQKNLLSSAKLRKPSFALKLRYRRTKETHRPGEFSVNSIKRMTRTTLQS